MTQQKIAVAISLIYLAFAGVMYGLYSPVLNPSREAMASTPPPLVISRTCDMEAGVVCFHRGDAMSCLPQSQVEPVCP